VNVNGLESMIVSGRLVVGRGERGVERKIGWWVRVLRAGIRFLVTVPRCKYSIGKEADWKHRKRRETILRTSFE